MAIAGNVTVIPPKRTIGTQKKTETVQKTRVAAYCRVSTEFEEQESSYEMQVEHYTSYIISNPDWELVEVYADDGISATNTAKRESFNRMIQDCRNGKIDMILTKSISRFSRNTVDCLKFTRELKGLNIAVYFEKENIWTFDSKGELLLTIMSSLAQEESRSISENVRWGQRKKFSDGKYSLNYKHFLGYDKGEDGRLVVNQEQAKIVRRIFGDFLAGHTPFQIAKALTAEGIPTPAGKTKWSYTTVRRVLSNETYMGDKLLQKTYSIDSLSKDRLKNHGEVPQFYVEQDHDAIIPPTTFKRVQDELERRKGCHATGKSIFSGKIYCGECGEIYGSKVWHSNDPYRKVVWQCNGKYDSEKKCGTPTVTEEDIKRGFERMLRQMDKQAQIANLREIYADVMAYGDLEQEKERLEAERGGVSGSYEKEISQNARAAQDQGEYQKRADELAAEYNRLDAEVKAVEAEIQKRQLCGRRIEPLVAALETAGEDFTVSLWGSMVEKVTVFEDALLFTLTSGKDVRV